MSFFILIILLNFENIIKFSLYFSFILLQDKSNSSKQEFDKNFNGVISSILL